MNNQVSSESETLFRSNRTFAPCGTNVPKKGMVMNMYAEENLAEMFELCLNSRYRHTEEGGDYALLRRGQTLYLLFEWSKGREDWKNNLDFPAICYDDTGRKWFCHRGFLKVFKAIVPYIEETLKNTDAERVIVVGYSHGAALAALAHEYIWYHRPDLRKELYGYGFGCPRCLWMPCFFPRIKERWENFIPLRNGGDLVTHLPPVFLGYSHVNKVLKIGQQNKYGIIKAHQPENYRTSLKSLGEFKSTKK